MLVSKTERSNHSLIQEMPFSKIIWDSTKNFFQSAMHDMINPFRNTYNFIFPCKSPQKTLEKISEVTNQGLRIGQLNNRNLNNRNLNNRNLNNPTQMSSLHSELDQLLAKAKKQQENEIRLAPECGSVARLSSEPEVDLEITIIPNLQDRDNTTNWKEKTVLQSKRLTEKLTVFAILNKMAILADLQKIILKL